VTSTLTRRLKLLGAKRPELNLVVSANPELADGFAHHETEPAIMARAMNAQHLWIVSYERPQDRIRLGGSWFNIDKKSYKVNTGLTVEVPIDSLNEGLDSLMVLMIGDSASPISRPSGGISRNSLKALYGEVSLPPRSRTLTVLAAPPYPLSADNKTLSLGLARILTKRLTSKEIGAFEVRPFDEELERYVECDQCFSPDSLRRSLNTQFALVLRIDNLGRTRTMYLDRINLSNPYDSMITVAKSVEHVDDMDNSLVSMTDELLQKWLPHASGAIARRDSAMAEISFQTFSKAFRARVSVLGFTEGSGGAYLGNDHQVGIEGSLIFYDWPRQYEISFMYDFGKRDTLNGVPYEVIGRYFFGVCRWNVPLRWGFKDWRCYFGLGVAFLNVDARSNHTRGSLVLGGQLLAGIEIPLTYAFFLDIGGTYTYPAEHVVGYDGYGNSSYELIKYWSITGGFGYRFW
jgi:hypothetical protein